MFRKLCMIRNNILMFRIICPAYTIRANIATNLRLHGKSIKAPGLSPPAAPSNDEGITISDINIQDLAKGDLEFTRNFLTTLTSFDNSNLSEMSMANAVRPEPEPNVSVGQDSNSDGAVRGSGSTTILDRDGAPIVPIEIDGWKNAADVEEDGPTVEGTGATDSIEIGNENEYKAEKMLQVPDKREGGFEYRGIKVKLPETANKDIGTYRFRRDAVDLATVADDMRVVKFDKK